MNLIFTLLFSFLIHSIYTKNIEHISTHELDILWNAWKQTYDKSYNTTSEDNFRKQIFFENYEKVHDHTVDPQHEDLKNISLILNQFADLTEEEFKKKFLINIEKDDIPSDSDDDDENEINPNKLLLKDKPHLNYKLLKIPEYIDWREKGGINPVKNQKSCGSCWAFASCAALETFVWKKTGKLYDFSEQNLVDCDKSSSGCGGGSITRAFTYTQKNGLQLEKDYPYKAKTLKCNYTKEKAISTNKGYLLLKAKNNAALVKTALLTQPVAIAIAANKNVFQFYNKGVLKGEACGTDLTHAVVIVGYKIINGEEAFIIRNSWGPHWGDNGYIYISTNSSYSNGKGTCGILSSVSIPT